MTQKNNNNTSPRGKLYNPSYLYKANNKNFIQSTLHIVNTICSSILFTIYRDSLYGETIPINFHWSVSPKMFTIWRCSLYRILTIWRVDCIMNIRLGQMIYEKSILPWEKFFVKAGLVLHLGTFQLIHSANPKSRPVGIIVFAHVVRPSDRPSPLFKSRKTKQQKTMFATGVTMGLAEWIIDDTCLVYNIICWSI